MMTGMNVHRVDRSGPLIVDGQGVVDIIGATWGRDVDLVVVPVERLAPEFFQLSSGVAGEVLQKFVTYGHHVAIVGDIGAHLAASSALRDFVQESNAGRHVWFVPDQAALDARLSDGSCYVQVAGTGQRRAAGERSKVLPPPSRLREGDAEESGPR